MGGGMVSKKSYGGFRAHEVKVRVSGDALFPAKGTPGSAGYDVRSALPVPVTVRPGAAPVRIPTGVFLEMPGGFEAQVRARSGLARKGVTVTSGVGTVDSDYRGEVVVLLSTFHETVIVSPGDRIAQLVFARLPEVALVRVEALAPSERGEGGFGSTGVA